MIAAFLREHRTASPRRGYNGCGRRPRLPFPTATQGAVHDCCGLYRRCRHCRTRLRQSSRQCLEPRTCELAAMLDKATDDANVKALVLARGHVLGRRGHPRVQLARRASRRPRCRNSSTRSRARRSSSSPRSRALRSAAVSSRAGCHYRVVQKDARLGLAEVKLGLAGRGRHPALPAARDRRRAQRDPGRRAIAGETVAKPLVDRPQTVTARCGEASASEKARRRPPPRVIARSTSLI